ncbi:MAG: CoA transferase [Alicyclobacillaceae bacterium]|nr:CoA transferase [Alicyclobacillaceae bacterium]
MSCPNRTLPLEDITVVSLEQAVSAPFATRQLADLGARVIKIERPGTGDFARHYDDTVHGLSSHFVWLNRSKESLTLDVKAEAGRQILRRLLERADVFVHNLAPGAVDRLGFGQEVLEADFPRLITCEISGYGRGGPHTDRKAYDLLIQCESGLLSVTGTPDTPSKVGISIADIAAGVYAFTGILTALRVRDRTGKGTFLEIAMLEALGEWMGYPYYFTAYGGAELERTGASHATIFPYGAFETADGQPVFFGVQNDREWQRFCEVVLERADLAQNPRYHTNANRHQYREELHPLIQDRLRQLSADELIHRLNQARIANAPLNSVGQFASHEQLRARGRWRTVATPAGPVEALLPPVTIAGWAVRMDPVPALGEHTDAILEELGLCQEAIRQLRMDGIV